MLSFLEFYLYAVCLHALRVWFYWCLGLSYSIYNDDFQVYFQPYLSLWAPYPNFQLGTEHSTSIRNITYPRLKSFPRGNEVGVFHFRIPQSMILPSIHSFMPGKPSIILHKTSLTGDIQSTPRPTTKSGQKTTSKYLRNLFSKAVFSFVLIKSYSAQSTPHLRNPSLVVRWLAMLWSCHSCADLCFCTYVIILHLHLPPSYIKIHQMHIGQELFWV